MRAALPSRGVRQWARTPRPITATQAGWAAVIAAGLIGAALFLVGLVVAVLIIAAGPAVADPTSPDPSAGSSIPAASSAAAAISISVSDGVANAKSGDRLAYQATVTNSGSADVQMLLEVTAPGGAKIVDAGGGTIRDDLIDYGITVLGHGRVTEKFALTLGAVPADQARVDTVASVFLLGAAGGGDGTTPNIRATDSDSVLSAAAHSVAGVESATSVGAATSTHRNWWLAALVLGTLLIISGLVLMFRRGSAPPRRSAGARSRRSSSPYAASPYAASLYSAGGYVAGEQPFGGAPTVAHSGGHSGGHSHGHGRGARSGMYQSIAYNEPNGRPSPFVPPQSLPPRSAGPNPGRTARRAAQAAANAGVRPGAHQASRSSQAVSPGKSH